MSRDFDVLELADFSLVHVATRADARAAATALSDNLDIDISAAPNSVGENGDHLAVLWFGPGRWLVRAPQPGWQPPVIDNCVVTDLSDSRRVFRLTGAGVCDYLAQACPLDLGAAATPPGSVALTQFDRFSVLLHRRELQVFDLYVERSYAAALPLDLAEGLQP